MMRPGTVLVVLLLTITVLAPKAEGQVQSDSTYAVQSGDTLYSIARRFGVSVEALKKWNELETAVLHEGQMLKIRSPQTDEARSDSSTAGENPTEHTTTVDSNAQPSVSPPPQPYGQHAIERGDSFVNLALRLGTTTDTLFSLNDQKTGALLPGQTVRLPRRFGPPTHVVESGETLFQIAGQYGVSIRALQAVNNMDTTEISPGQRLRLPTSPTPPVPTRGEWARADSTGPVAVFPASFTGRLTASGVPYEPDDFVVSHPSLPYGSVVLLSISKTNQHTFARVVDRGPLDEGVLVDVSEAVASRLGIERNDQPTVALRTVWIHRSNP